mgnify:CR=1 FL=1
MLRNVSANAAAVQSVAVLNEVLSLNAQECEGQASGIVSPSNPQ